MVVCCLCMCRRGVFLLGVIVVRGMGVGRRRLRASRWQRRLMWTRTRGRHRSDTHCWGDRVRNCAWCRGIAHVVHDVAGLMLVEPPLHLFALRLLLLLLRRPPRLLALCRRHTHAAGRRWRCQQCRISSLVLRWVTHVASRYAAVRWTRPIHPTPPSDLTPVRPPTGRERALL